MIARKTKITSAESLNNPIYKMIGTNIKNLRKSKRLTQDDLAKRSGYSTVSIIKFEKGRQRTSLDALECISKGLGVPIMALLTEDSSSEIQYWKNKYIETERKFQQLKLKVNELAKIMQE